MSFIKKAWESLRGGAVAAPVYEAASRPIIIPRSSTTTGETPAVPLHLLLEIYAKDPTARAAIDFLADQVVGMGFYTTAENPKAKQLVDEFCEQTGLDELLQTTAREIIATGNSFWMKVKPDFLRELKPIPPTNVLRIYRSRDGAPERYELTSGHERVKLPAREVIHFRWNPINNEAFGSGILRTLAEELSLESSGFQARKPLYRMKALMQQAMITQFQKFSAPNELWIFPNIPASELDVEKEGSIAWHIRNMPPSGARWVTNQAEADVKLAVAERSRSFDGYVKNIMDEYHLGLQTPILRLFIERGFTEASAKVAAEFAERKVVALQRFIKRVVERQVFWQVVEQSGLNPRKANVRLHWGFPEKPQITAGDMLRAFELGAISREELRRMLMKAGWELQPEGADGDKKRSEREVREK